MKPGVRLTDDHTCPSMEHGPHVGGPVARIGCNSVLMEKKPSARGGDIAQCNVATDVIIKGSGTVWIGGMPAARIDEACLHGGRVTSGADEVFIGGEAIDPPNIDRIIENVREMDDLMRKLKEQHERLQKLQDYIDGPHELPPAEKALYDLLKKLANPQGSGLPPGGDNFDDEEAQQLERAWEERKELSKKMLDNMERIKELERQNRRMQRGQPPHPDNPGAAGGTS